MPGSKKQYRHTKTNLQKVAEQSKDAAAVYTPEILAEAGNVQSHPPPDIRAGNRKDAASAHPVQRGIYDPKKEATKLVFPREGRFLRQ